MDFLLPGLFALGSGIANMISGDQAEQQRNAQINAAEGVLRQNLLNDKDLNNLLLSNKRYYNAGLSNLLNSTAISTRGVANAPVVAGAVASNVVGKEAQSATQIQENVLNNNRDVRNRIAMLETQRGSNSPIADFFGGAVSGLTAGMEFNKYLNLSSDAGTPSGNGQPNYTSTPTSSMQGFLPPSISSQNPYRFQLGVTGSSMNNPFGGKATNPFMDYLGDDQMKLKNNAMFRFNYY